MRTFAQARSSTNGANPGWRRVLTHSTSSPPRFQSVAIRHILRGPQVQAKLTIGSPNDQHEREADRVANEVMRMSEAAAKFPITASPKSPSLQRLCPDCVAKQARGEDLNCPECEADLQLKPEMKLQQEASQAIAAPENVPGVTPATAREIHGLRGRGQTLPSSARTFMERRFGHDFGDVRVHRDDGANRLARSVQARAFTTGRHIVFGRGEYTPETTSGRRLLAHELTHVVQQRGTGDFSGTQDSPTPQATPDTIQRSCGSSAIGAPPGCITPPDFGHFRVGTGSIYQFTRNCDTFVAGHDATLAADARALPAGTSVEIHGFASLDGNATYNHNLACARALEAQSLLTTAGPVGGGLSASQISGVFTHGETPGPVDDRRSVTIETTAPPAPTPPAPEPRPLCGPDATDWFIAQLNAATSDPAVLAVQTDISAADRIARRYGVTASTFSEGGSATAIEGQETLLGLRRIPRPARAGAIVPQMAAGIASLSAALGALPRALAAASPLAIPGIIADFARINTLMASAALGWRALVNHGARYDFKAHIMNHPSGGSCPHEDCPPGEVGIITLCPGTLGDNCYQTDLPGNLFYSRIGLFVGFSTLTLQLGSQFAELTDLPRPGRPAITWDSPEDTSSINLGARLPLPLTRASFCSLIPSSRASLSRQDGCDDCNFVFPPTRLV